MSKELKDRIFQTIKLVPVEERKKCQLVMSEIAYDDLDDYLHSRMTYGHPEEMWQPGQLKNYLGMPIVIDESVTWDFHVQHPTKGNCYAPVCDTETSS
jgi:hypothetical protein